MTTPPPRPVERETLTVREVATILGVSHGYLYDRIKRGLPLPFPVLAIGNRYVIPRAAVYRHLGPEPPGDTP